MQALRICIQHQSQQSCLLQYHALSLTCKVLRSQLQILDCQSSGRLSPAQRPLRRGRPQRGVKPGVVQTPAQPEVVLDLPSVDCRETFQKALVLQDWPQALQVFKQNTRDILATATPMALQSLVQGLSRAQCAMDAMEVYDVCKQASVTFNRKTYENLISAAVKAVDPAGALGIFRDCQAAGHQPNRGVHCQLMSALAKAHRPHGWRLAQAAYQLWQELLSSGQPLDAAAFRAGMHACTMTDRLEEARGLLDTMAAAGHPPDVRAFNILLKGCSLEGASGLDLMAAVLDTMEKAGVERSPVTQNTLVDAYVRAGRLEDAKRVGREAMEGGQPLDVWGHSTLIKGSLQAGDLKGAHDLLHQMQRLGVPPNVVTFTTLLDGYVKAGDLAAARRLWSEMRRCGVLPNAATFNTLLAGLAASPEPEPLRAVYELYGQMETYKVRPTVDTYNTLLKACMQHGETKQAMAIFKRLRQSRRGPDVVTYTTLINGFSDAGRPAAAVRAFEEMESDPNVKPDVACINAMVDALQRLGDMAAAEAYLSQAAQLAQQQGQPPPIEAYGAVIEGYAKQLDAEAALGVLKDFFELGGEADSRMYDIVVDVCVRTQKFQRALQVMKTMESQGQPVDKQRIKRRLEQVFRRQSKVQRASHRHMPSTNENLERLKFWLGLENRYYS
ncbi:hypothetical protein WJX84_006572 [Apatococcus fuscideae]|uniref:Pentatricopeptide repeat-containing protein-mitochondrial domain-containing protein n=1 Tax=Apatococcus fuscideae TaxID=2026836 RepID=A0AAW1TKJ8_9CHLO